MNLKNNRFQYNRFLKTVKVLYSKTMKVKNHFV